VPLQAGAGERPGPERYGLLGAADALIGPDIPASALRPRLDIGSKRDTSIQVKHSSQAFEQARYQATRAERRPQSGSSSASPTCDSTV
jgi:hypothetical protein